MVAINFKPQINAFKYHKVQFMRPILKKIALKWGLNLTNYEDYKMIIDMYYLRLEIRN